MKRTITICLAAGWAFGALLHGDTVHAQQLSYAISSEKPAVSPEILEARAAELYDSPKQYRRAAELHLEAAELREFGDPLRVRNQSYAARLYYYAGDKGKAQTTLETAADDARNAGDIITAADLYLDASYVATERKNAAEVHRLVEKAELLMSSPLVDAGTRDRVLGRIEVNG